MNFTTYLHHLDAYYTAWLESSGHDEVSLAYAVDTAAKALKMAPLARLAVLGADQQAEVTNLRQLHAQAAASASWDQPSRRAWLEAARELLRLLRG